jgi:hypothetical protein
MHAPDWQVSAVQRFASTLHEVPASFGTMAEHTPDTGLQVPAVLH